MTQALVPSDEQINQVAALLTNEQVALLLRYHLPTTTGWSAFESTIGALAERLAGTGLTPDLARHWALQVEQAASNDPRPEAVALADKLVPAFMANGLTASEAKAWEFTILEALRALAAPAASVIDTTATVVPEPPSAPTQPSWVPSGVQ